MRLFVWFLPTLWGWPHGHLGRERLCRKKLNGKCNKTLTGGCKTNVELQTHQQKKKPWSCWCTPPPHPMKFQEFQYQLSSNFLLDIANKIAAKIQFLVQQLFNICESVKTHNKIPKINLSIYESKTLFRVNNFLQIRVVFLQISFKCRFRPISADFAPFFKDFFTYLTTFFWRENSN